MEISPIFVQWIDAVSQIVSQLPNSFEFTEAFLISLVDHARISSPPTQRCIDLILTGWKTGPFESIRDLFIQ
jgi:hypothetical protein